MKGSAVFLCLFLAMISVSCSRAPAAEASEPAPYQTDPVLISVPVKLTAAAVASDGADEFLMIMDAAAKQQPCTAGSSLRLAALGSGLLGWLADHPGQQAEALRLAADWAVHQDREMLRQAARTFRLLGDCALHMGEEELHSLLYDAGCSLTDPGLSRRELFSLIEELTRVFETDYSEFVKKNEYFSVKSLQSAEKRVMICVNTRNIQRMIR